jgi:hypothetical protein
MTGSTRAIEATTGATGEAASAPGPAAGVIEAAPPGP